MRRALPIAAVLLAGQIGAAWAETAERPPPPAWATDAGHCAWRWIEGGGIGFWAETCALGPGVRDIAWDAETGAFWERLDGAPWTRVVEPWPLDPEREIGQLIAALQGVGALAQDSDCAFRPADEAAEGGTVERYRLTPATGWPLDTPAGGGVPDDPCGPYGVSAGAVRYVLIDRRWPDRAVFVDAGQERPGEGHDRIHSSVFYTLPEHMEELILTESRPPARRYGSDAINIFSGLEAGVAAAKRG